MTRLIVNAKGPREGTFVLAVVRNEQRGCWSPIAVNKDNPDEQIMGVREVDGEGWYGWRSRAGAVYALGNLGYQAGHYNANRKTNRWINLDKATSVMVVPI